MKKKKLTILLVFHCLALIHGFAQNQVSAEWLINSSGNEWSMVSDQETDNDGNVFITGYFNAEMGLGNSSGRLQSNQSVFVAKVNEKGSVVWMKKFSSTQFCYSNSIIAGRDGSVFVCGNYQGEINENGVSLTSPDTKNTFIIQLDAKGKILWGNSIKGSFRNKHLFISQDNDGNLLFAGSFLGELTLNNNHYDSHYFCDIAIVKLDGKGNLMGWQILEGKDDDLVNDLICSPKGDVLLTGSFEKDLVVGNTTLVSQGNRDVFLIRLNENLEYIDALNFGSGYDDEGKALAMDKNENLVLSGSFNGTLQYDNIQSLTSKGKSDVFVMKFDQAGKPIWSKSFGSEAGDYVSSLDINGLNEIYVTGIHRGAIKSVASDPKPKDLSMDIFLAKYDENGVLQFIESFGGENHDFVKTICLDNNNDIYVNGNFCDDLEVLGTPARKSGDANFFLSKLHDCSTTLKIELPADTTVCGEEFILVVDKHYEQYFWNGYPGTNEFRIDSTGWYALEAIDRHGCSSADTMFVQLNKPAVIDSVRHFVLKESKGIILNDMGLKTLSLEISPNPVKNKLTVKIENIDTQSVLSLFIIAANGEEIWKESSMPSEVYLEKIINVNFIQPGTYILIIRNDKTTVKRIFVVI